MPVYRIEVRSVHAGDDPHGAGVVSEVRQMGIDEVVDVRSSRIFLLQGDAGVLTGEVLERIAREVLIDPVTEIFSILSEHGKAAKSEGKVVEVHLKAGVMDPVATSCEMAISDLLSHKGVEVRTGRRYELIGHATDDVAALIARRLLVNESIETGYFGAAGHVPAEFPKGAAVCVCGSSMWRCGI